MSIFNARPALTALLALTVLAGPVSAQDRSVSFNRRELDSEAGTARILDRIEAAAHAVCRTENRHSAMEALSIRVCTRDTLARAIHALNSPCLTDLGSGLPSQRILLLCAHSALPHPDKDVQ